MLRSIKEYILKCKVDFFSGSERSVLMKKNILLTLSLRIFTVFPSILLVPLTIDYVNPEQYGLWLTLSSVLALMSLFDFGLSNGFRNSFTEARAINNNVLAGQLVSTTYFVISVISLILFVLLEMINMVFNWCEMLNVSQENNVVLRDCFAYLILFFCLKLVANILTSLLTADQKPSLASLLQAIGQVLSLLAIIAIRSINETGTIVELAILYSGIPFFVFLIGTGYFFIFTKYKEIRPRFRDIRLNLVKDIMTLGVKFFIVTCCSLAIFQLMSIIITRELGGVAVTQYNVAQKYFNILYMPAIIILTPIWSAVTDAYVKTDFAWILRLKKRIETIWYICIGIAVVMVFASSPIYYLWIGNKVQISQFLSIMMAIYVLAQIIGTAYMYMLNGVGAVIVQMLVYIIFAVLSCPMFIYSARTFGLEGMMIIPIAFFVVQSLLGNMQLKWILKNKKRGIWMK